MRILIFRTEHIGDYALSLNAIKSIKEKFPMAKIDVVVGPWNKSLAKATPYINNIISWKNPFVKRNISNKDILKILILDFWKILKFSQEMNKRNYDLLINFSDREYNKILLKFFRVKKKISGHYYPNKGVSESKRIENLLSKYDISKPKKNAKLKYLKEDMLLVEKYLKKIRNKNKIIIHAMTPLNEKNWPMHKWKRLIKEILVKKKNTSIIFIGTKLEKEKIERLIKDFKKDVFNFAGKFNLVQTTYLIEKCNLIIGCDSGPMHLAELTDTPIIALFGPTNEKIWGPHRKKDKIIKKIPIENISVKEVINKIK